VRCSKEPTCTSIVQTAVTAADDFVTAKWVVEATRLTPNQVSAALYHLKKYTFLSCFESDGKLWWFSTPETDTRSRTVERRAPEAKPRKTRKTHTRKTHV